MGFGYIETRSIEALRLGKMKLKSTIDLDLLTIILYQMNEQFFSTTKNMPLISQHSLSL